MHPGLIFFKRIQAVRPRLQVNSVNIMQVYGGKDSIIANKPYVVSATITTSEPSQQTSAFMSLQTVKVQYFLCLQKENIGLNFNFENPATLVNMPQGQAFTALFLLDDEGLAAGNVPITVTVDPPMLLIQRPRDGNKRRQQFNDRYNRREGNKMGKRRLAGYEDFVQPFDGYPLNKMDAVQRWSDTAKTFMEKVWPMKTGQASMTVAAQPVDYSYIHPDSLDQDSWEYYLQKML